jgi:D-alanyl-D-alanine endopeptidase (penicillin-binding protein 7)
MRDTNFADPTGLDQDNISNARDLVRLVLAAHNYPEITSASSQAKVSIPLQRGHADFGNTNPMVRMGEDIVVSKTGYINSSGGCVVMMLNTDDGPRVVVVLGSRSTKTRIPEAKLIMARL